SSLLLLPPPRSSELAAAPGNRVRAAGVRHGAIGAVVHRVCADAGRGGAGIGLCGPDAHPHDVLGIVAPRTPPQSLVQHGGGLARKPGAGLSPFRSEEHTSEL